MGNKDLSDQLTIILTLKDRSAFTYRWMEWMNESRCPYKILIADGGADKEIEEHLKDSSNYPYLNYEYIRYPYDENLEIFWEKWHNVIQKVSTPYTMLADNDDFFNLDILPKFINFMRTNTDYGVVSSNNVLSFNVLTKHHSCEIDDLVKSKRLQFFTYHQNSSIKSDTQIDRLKEIISRYSSSFWYGVIRTEVIKDISTIIKNSNCKITNTPDYVFIFSLALYGKMHLENSCHLARQQNTSQGAAIQYPGYGDTAHLMCTETWRDDFQKMTESLSQLYKEDTEKFKSIFFEHYSQYLKKQIINQWMYQKSAKRLIDPSIKNTIKHLISKIKFQNKQIQDFEKNIIQFMSK